MKYLWYTTRMMIEKMMSKFIVGISILVAFSLPIYAHGFYADFKTPVANESCCGDADCHPVDLCITENGREGLQLGPGWCAEIRSDAILSTPSPDGRAHVCLGSMEGDHPERGHETSHWQRCVILPGNV